MEVIFESIGRAAVELEQQLLEESSIRFPYEVPDSVDSILDSVNSLIRDLTLDLADLNLFLDCVHKWSDAHDVVPSCSSLVTKMESFLAEIENQLTSEMLRLRVAGPPERASLFSFNRKNQELKLLEKTAMGLIDVFSTSTERLHSLEPHIKEVIDCCLSCQYSFQCYTPAKDIDGWQSFVYSVLFVKLESLKSEFPGPIAFFKDRMYPFMNFLVFLMKNGLDDPKMLHFMHLFGTVAIRAALVFCHYNRLMRKYPRKDKEIHDVATTLLDLQLEVESVTADFVDMGLRSLRRCLANLERRNREMEYENKEDVELVNVFVGCFLCLTESGDLYEDLVSLIVLFIRIPDEDIDNLRRFSADVKDLIIKLVALQTGEIQVCYQQDLLPNIWLVMIEIFLREQLIVGNGLFPDEVGIGLLSTRKEYSENSQTYPRDEKRENIEQIKTLQEEVSSIVASFNLRLFKERITIDMSRSVCFQLLVMVMLFKAKSLLLRFHKNNETLPSCIKDQLKTLVWWCEFLRLHIRYFPCDKLMDGKVLLTHVEAVALRVLHLSAEKAIEGVGLLIPHILDDMKSIRVQLKEIFLFGSMSNFPRTDGLGFLETLLKRFRELINSNADLNVVFGHQLAEIFSNLEFLRSFLNNLQDQEIEELGNLRNQVTDVAYEVEYLIDSVLVGLGDEWRNSLWLCHLQEDTQCLKQQVSKIHKKRTYEDKTQDTVQSSISVISHENDPRAEKFVVSLIDQEDAIIDKLTRGSLERKVVSVVGMPGIGKTTLAKKVYNNSRVIHNFHVRAWCYVSQRYEKRRWLLEVLNLIGGVPVDHLNKTDEDLEAVLCRRLREKKYLIVMDDIWDTEVWDGLRNTFPNDGNGSRILTTSRYYNVPLKAQPDMEPHSLRPLSLDESWALLQTKIFHEKRCPDSVAVVGKEIAANCKGLPLAVVAIAGLLESTDPGEDHWRQIAQHLSSLIIDDPVTRCKDILELSYNHLPDHLKACFLYFGAFAVDKDISVSKLIWLWISEGFISEAQSSSLEDLAELYLIDLISRSLVKVTKQRSNGGVKACRVHDLLRDLCLSKAREDNFMKVITRYEEASADFTIDLEYYSYPLDSVPYEDHRLCFFSKRKPFVMSMPSGLCVRSLLFNAISDTYPTRPYDLSFVSVNFKLLKVLDLECINSGGSFPSGIESLVHLRYLAITGDLESVPSSIENLTNLQIFLVKGLLEKVVLPDTIWHMARLRHLHVNKYAVFSMQDKRLYKLDNLVTLSSPILSFGEDIEKMTRRLPNLKKLRCIFSESRRALGKGDIPLRFDFLAHLESLAIFCYVKAPKSCEFYFPLNLKKLTMSNFRLPWNHISVIGQLPNLKVLKLLSRAFEGETWEMVDGEFCELKFLELDGLDIVQWNASSDSLPKLEQLIVRSCKHLEEVPYLLGEIPTLQTVELHGCAHSCEMSAGELKESNEGLQIFINISASDRTMSS